MPAKSGSYSSVAHGVCLLRRLPENFDLVDHLRHAFHAGNGRLRQLLQIETGDLPAKIKLPAAKVAPDSLHGQVRVVPNTIFCRGDDLVGLYVVRKGSHK